MYRLFNIIHMELSMMEANSSYELVKTTSELRIQIMKILNSKTIQTKYDC